MQIEEILAVNEELQKQMTSNSEVEALKKGLKQALKDVQSSDMSV